LKNLRLTLIAFLFLTTFKTAFSWGFFAHQRINRLAVFTLPPEMITFYKQNIVFLTENSVNPDRRRYAVEGEVPKHYIDIDVYGDSALFKMPHNWKDAVAKYTEDTLMAYGINPWWVNKMQYQLTEAFKLMDAKAILRISADLGHYIADGNVPLHTTQNYNGQYTNQVGIHGFWESRLPELYSDDYDYFVGNASYVKNPQQRAWESITAAHLALDSVLRFEKELTKTLPEDKKYTFEERNGITIRTYSKPFSKAYHQALQGQVERRMKASIKMVGDFWYTAWVDAGQPNLDLIIDFKFSDEDRKLIQDENDKWKQKMLEVRPESRRNSHDEESQHAHLDCCGQHDFFTYRMMKKLK
jgi:hypothetical protein